ncbi:MAG TPA: TolC family protein [Bacteroidia bacterium]|nr:TolC family protein [Bacteroidia bacterium]
MLSKIFILLIVLSSGIHAQSVLTIEDAIKTGLEKNYAVLMVKNEQEITKLQNNFGNAGMSPTVSINGNLSLANINSYQEFSTGVIQERNGAQSNNAGASVNVGWMIFDGLKMFAVKKRLGLNEQLSAIELKQQMENTVYEIVAAYYSVVKTNELIKAAKQNLSIYEERKKIAKLKYDIGSDSKVDLLLSQSNENKAKSVIVQLELQLLNAKTKLNSLLNKPVDTDFTTTDSIVVNYNPNIDDLKKEVSKSNSSILISKQNESIISQSIKEARSANLPFIQLNGAYNFTRAQSQAGFVFLNRQAGLNAGLTAGWLLFNGTKNSKLVKEKNILFLNQRYLTEQTQLQVDAQVYNSYKTYLLNKSIVELEKQNLEDSKEVLNVSIERYKVGKANLLETIETQKNLEDAQVRYIEALYAIKLAETDLLRANGSLVK